MRMLLIALVCCFFAACSSHHDKKNWREADNYQRSRYSLKQDAIPVSKLHPDKIPDAVPKAEPIRKAGNYSPYTVFGKTYRVKPSAKGYKATGEASWYGMKFHGHSTSNGEKYDVNKMTAAHKTLPIPSYVKVTNLANKRTCIVRVNDRGPFKGDRLIDLSYAAATKLGFGNAGTTRVRIEAIDVKKWHPEKHAIKKGVYLQVGAYCDEAIAQQQYHKLYVKYPHPLKLKRYADRYSRLFIGPISQSKVDEISASLKKAGYPKPMVLDNI